MTRTTPPGRPAGLAVVAVSEECSSPAASATVGFPVLDLPDLSVGPAPAHSAFPGNPGPPSAGPPGRRTGRGPRAGLQRSREKQCVYFNVTVFVSVGPIWGGHCGRPSGLGSVGPRQWGRRKWCMCGAQRVARVAELCGEWRVWQSGATGARCTWLRAPGVAASTRSQGRRDDSDVRGSRRK